MARETGVAGLAVGEGEEDLVTFGGGGDFRPYVQNDPAACISEERSVSHFPTVSSSNTPETVYSPTLMAEHCPWSARQCTIGRREVRMADSSGVDLHKRFVWPDDIKAHLSQLEGALDIRDSECRGSARHAGESLFAVQVHTSFLAACNSGEMAFNRRWRVNGQYTFLFRGRRSKREANI